MINKNWLCICDMFYKFLYKKYTKSERRKIFLNYLMFHSPQSASSLPFQKILEKKKHLSFSHFEHCDLTNFKHCEVIVCAVAHRSSEDYCHFSAFFKEFSAFIFWAIGLFQQQFRTIQNWNAHAPYHFSCLKFLLRMLSTVFNGSELL